MDEELKSIVDRAKVQQVYTRYATSVNRCDWSGLQSVFTDKLDRDMPSFTGTPVLETIDSTQHVNECCATLPGFDSTQHFFLNNEITIDGDEAKAVVYMIADHNMVEDGTPKQFTIRGVYTYKFICVAADWKIPRHQTQCHFDTGRAEPLHGGRKKGCRYERTAAQCASL